MKQARLKATWIVVLALAALLGVATGVGCGGGEQASSATPTGATRGRATSPPATATPPATRPGQGQITPTAQGWVPPIGTVDPYATPFELPYRVIITGPATARPGDEVKYEIGYECVLDAQVCDNTRLSLRLDWPNGGTLIDFSPAADLDSPLGLAAAGVTFHGAAGVDQATFQIANGFSGDFGLGITLTGSGLNYRWPEGTEGVTTHVVAETTP